MQKRAVLLSVLCVLAAHVPPSQTCAQATPEVTPEHLQQLQTCREGILDESARPQDRKRWAEMLFSYSTPQADALFVELLALTDRPDVRRAICDVFASLGRENRGRLSPTFVPPLLAVLAAESADLRSSAGAALAEFPSDQVAEKLGALAARADAPLMARIAAVNALAPNTHRREVVKQLITLLDQRVPAITESVVAALSPIAPNHFGANVDQWRRWWKNKSRLSNEAWLAEQLKHYRDRARQTTVRLAILEEDFARQQAALTERLMDSQREVLRSLSDEQKADKLVEWMDDPLAQVKQGAIALVRSGIADEGKRPTGAVLASLLRLLDHPATAIRRDVLTIAQNLREDVVVDAVLARLDIEDEPALRQAILHAIGMLASPKAVPALLREIAGDPKDPASVTIAAQALARIASGRPTDTDMASSVPVLKRRYTKTAADAVELRAALLSAMAGVGDPSFAPEFLEALGSDHAQIVKPALLGVKVVGDTSRLPRVRSLAGDPDARIRRAAVDALAALGRDDADLESLLARLNPTVEADESVRQTSWQAFRRFLSRRPIDGRIAAAQRLREWPDLEVKYLEELANVLATAGQYDDSLETLRERLATLSTQAGKYDEAVPHLRELYAMRFGREDPRAGDAGLRWIGAVLRSSTRRNLSEVVVRVAEGSADPAVRSRIVDVIRASALETDLTADPDRSARLLSELRSINSELFGESWKDLLEEIEAQIAGPKTPPESPDVPAP